MNICDWRIKERCLSACSLQLSTATAITKHSGQERKKERERERERDGRIDGHTDGKCAHQSHWMCIGEWLLPAIYNKLTLLSINSLKYLHGKPFY